MGNMDNMAAQALILATVFLCPIGTPPSQCTIETAAEVHMVNVHRGTCERDAEMIAAQFWFVYGKEFVLKVKCG
jgi:hypothetical protein